MRGVFVHTFTVPPEAIDVNGHVNNLEYLRWMQEVATRHSAAQGWPVERYLKTRTSWVVRSHHIEYLRAAFAADSISILTWIAGFGEHMSPRKYLFWRARDQQILARAETLWVFVDASTGRPRRIPSEFKDAFDVIVDEENALQVVRTGHSEENTKAGGRTGKVMTNDE
jgi:acyl-CoA thioester hydrolase